MDFKAKFNKLKNAAGVTGKKTVVELLGILPAKAVSVNLTTAGDFVNLIPFKLSDGSYGFGLTTLHPNTDISKIEIHNLFEMTQKPESFELNGVKFRKFSIRTRSKTKTATEDTHERDNGDLPFEP